MKFHTSEGAVESDTGFSVKVLGRAKVLYKDAQKAVTFGSEPAVAPTGMIVYSDDLQVLDETGLEISLSRDEKTEVIERVREAFKFMGFEIDVF